MLFGHLGNKTPILNVRTITKMCLGKKKGGNPQSRTKHSKQNSLHDRSDSKIRCLKHELRSLTPSTGRSTEPKSTRVGAHCEWDSAAAAPVCWGPTITWCLEHTNPQPSSHDIPAPQVLHTPEGLSLHSAVMPFSRSSSVTRTRYVGSGYPKLRRAKKTKISQQFLNPWEDKAAKDQQTSAAVSSTPFTVVLNSFM